MKKLIYIMLSLCCLVFYSCGMTEPWKDWEHEGDMSADRLRPSEVKELLCAADGWKMIYQGVTFYFQFDEEGNVASDSDETLLKNEVGTDYSLDFQGEKAVLLTLLNGGMLRSQLQLCNKLRRENDWPLLLIIKHRPWICLRES